MNKTSISRFTPLVLWLPLITSITPTGSTAAIIRPLDDQNAIEISISQDDLTRIAVQGDRILNVFGKTGEYVLESDEEQGQIFIKPNQDLNSQGSQAIYLTLTTEKGHTQDLRLLPKDKTPETLLLKEEEEDVKQRKLKRNVLKQKPPFSREDVEELLTACRHERIPLGYKEIPLELSSLNSPYPLIRELRGEHLRGLTYEIKNTSKARRILSEPEFVKTCGLSSHEIVAILMPKKILNPQEGVHVHVVTRAN